MRTISFADWSNLINQVQVSGFEEGDGVVKFEWLGKDTSSVGADGNMAVYLTANKSVKVTLTLQAVSPGNAYLSKLWALQKGGPRRMVPITYSAKDSFRQDKVAGWFGYISAPPPVERGEKLGKFVWEFTFERGVMDLADPTFAGLAVAVAELSSGA